MALRFVVIALLVTMGLVVILGERHEYDDIVVVVEDLDPRFQEACAADLGMCRCQYPLLQFVAENEELMALNLEAVEYYRTNEPTTIGQWAASWMAYADGEDLRWHQAYRDQLDEHWINDCMMRHLAAQERARGGARIPTFDEAVDSLEDRQ